MLERTGSQMKHLVTRRRFLYGLSSAAAAALAGENVVNLVQTRIAIDSFSPRINAYVQDIANDQARRRTATPIPSPSPSSSSSAEWDAKQQKQKQEQDELVFARNQVTESYKYDIENLEVAKNGFLHNFIAFTVTSASFAIATYSSKEKLWGSDTARKNSDSCQPEGGSRLGFAFRRLKMRVLGPRIPKGIKESFEESETPQLPDEDFIV